MFLVCRTCPKSEKRVKPYRGFFIPPSFAKGPCGQLLLGCPSPLSSGSVSAHPHGCCCRTVTSPCLLPGHTALATGRGLGLTLRCSQGMLWLGDSSRTSSLPGGQRASRTAALTVLCPQPCDVESEGGGEGRFTSMQPFRAVCCMALALLPANALAAPCPGVPSSASNALKPDLVLQSPGGICLCLGSSSPAAGAPPPLRETYLSEGDCANARSLSFLRNELLNTLG